LYPQRDPHPHTAILCWQAWHTHRLRGRTRTITDVSEEAYLRDDVPCASAACPAGCRPMLPRVSRRVLCSACALLASHHVGRCIDTISSTACSRLKDLRESQADLQITSPACQPHNSKVSFRLMFAPCANLAISWSTFDCRDATHYVMPDTAAVVAWLEVLEQPEMGGFVLLTSVLKQARPVRGEALWLYAAWGSGVAIHHTAQQ